MRTLLLTIIIVLLYALSGTATTTQSITDNYPEGSDMYECQHYNNCGEDFMNEVSVYE